MTIYESNALPFERELVIVFDLGRPFMTRREEFMHYNLLGRFFVKGEFDTASSSIVGLRRFACSMPHEHYKASIQLPDWLT